MDRALTKSRLIAGAYIALWLLVVVATNGGLRVGVLILGGLLALRALQILMMTPRRAEARIEAASQQLRQEWLYEQERQLARRNANDAMFRAKLTGAMPWTPGDRVLATVRGVPDVELVFGKNGAIGWQSEKPVKGVSSHGPQVVTDIKPLD